MSRGKFKTIRDVTHAFDIETLHWDQWLCGAVVSRDELLLFTRDEQEFLKYILSLDECVISAWNGGGFDFLWILDGIERLYGQGFYTMTSALYAGSKLVCARIDTELGGIHLVDPVAVIPQKLSKAAEVTGVGKLDPPDFSRAPSSDQEWEEMRRYCVRDTDRVLDIIDHYVSSCDDWGVSISYTLASSGVATLHERYNLPRNPLFGNLHLAKYVREAAYGGRVGVYTLEADDVVSIDINNAYGAATTKNRFPTGEYFEMETDEEIEDYLRAYLDDDGPDGVVTADVTVPEMFLPPLPVRHGRSDVYYPYGSFTGTWVVSELLNALQYGVTLDELIYGIGFTSSDDVFGSFAKDMHDIRVGVGKKSSYGEWLKRLVNAGAYGYNLQKFERTSLVHRPATPSDVCEPTHDCGGNCDSSCYRGQCCWEQCSGACGAMDVIDPLRNFWLSRRWYQSARTHYEWGVKIPAAVRMIWLNAAHESGLDNLCYGDTDSLKLRSQPPKRLIGDDIGQWSIEGEFTNCRFDRSKCYAGIDKSTGNWSVVCSGVPIDDIERYRDYVERGETVRIERGVLSLKSALRAKGPLFTRKVLTRSFNANRRVISNRWVSGNRTYPPAYREIPLMSRLKDE